MEDVAQGGLRVADHVQEVVYRIVMALLQIDFQEKLDDVDADDAAARFDAAFSLMTLELARLIPGLLEALGGEDRSAIVEES